MAEKLPYASCKFISFNDFDGTITTKDSNDYMTDNLGMGEARRRQYNDDILYGKISFQDAFAKEIASVADNKTFEECCELVKKNITLDPGFKDYFDWCKEQKIPVVIVSSGMKPIIRAILSNLLGEEDANTIEIISNDVEIGSDGKFAVKFIHPESPFGHDKSKALRPYKYLPDKNRPIIFFCGDGVSDMSAAGESDVLFVKVIPGGHNDLYDYCKKKNVPFIAYINFVQVQKIVKEITEGKILIKDIDDHKISIPEVEKALKEGQKN